MRFMDVVKTYLCGFIYNDIYMKILEEFKLFETNNAIPHNMYLILLQPYLYRSK